MQPWEAFAKIIKKWLLYGFAVLYVLYGLLRTLVSQDPALTFVGMLFWGAVGHILYLCRPGSFLHRCTGKDGDLPQTLIFLLVLLLTISSCLYPMGKNDVWNGEIPGHRNQYELLAESFLEGKLYIDYGEEDELITLKNPYDPQERKDSGVSYHWDHAYYNGRYYVYFGVVPVLLTFLPYRVLTGTSLTTYHATQIFAAVFIAGMFCLFRLLRRRFFSRLSEGQFLSLCVACSVLSIWYSVAEPALYCTAIVSALGLEIWSLYCFARAVWVEKEENRQIAWAFFGALLGALTFGCRPTVALANILVLPMLGVFLRQRKLSKGLIAKLVLAALPYVIVAGCLMGYNYVRFDSPFEFGQSYQLTLVDQTDYGGIGDETVRTRLINETIRNFIQYSDVSLDFPYVTAGGMFVNFPLLLLVFLGLRADIRRECKRKGLGGFLAVLSASPLIITFLSVIWSPWLMERYRMDIYFLVCILCFCMVGLWQGVTEESERPKNGCIVMLLSLAAVLSAMYLYLRDQATDKTVFYFLVEQCLTLGKQ